MKVSPPPKLTISEWADKYRHLSEESSPEPGRWKTSSTPYLKFVMDAISDPLIEEVVFVASAQVGKSECLNNCLGYFVHIEPSPIMLVQPRIEDAENYSKSRIAPMIRDTPVLKKLISPVRSKDSGNSILRKVFPGGRLKISGANAPASLASDPIRVLLVDELDRMPLSSGTEGSPFLLARKRTNNFRNRKIAAFSTPTEKKTSQIEELWEKSDKRYFMMPCPHCTKKIRFTWERFKYVDDNPETVVFLCPECDAIIEEKHKPAMLAKIEAIPTAPFTGIAGFRIWEAYSPWRRWSEIVADFLRVKDYPESLKVWVNTSLGESWEEKDGDIPDWKRLYDRRELYQMDTIPDGVYFLTGAADVQADRIEVEIKGWGKNLENFSICRRIISGNTSLDEPWLELDKMLAEQWPCSDGQLMPIRLFAVDSGFNTQRVYNFVRKYPSNRVIAIKGSSSLETMVAPGSKVDVNVRGQWMKRNLKIWRVGVDVIKSEIMGFLRSEKPADGKPFPPGYYHFPQYEEEYFKQLTAEHIELQRDRRGFGRWVWVKHYERNEILDLAAYNRACAAILGIDRMKEQHWESLKSGPPLSSATSTSPSASEPSKPREERKVKQRRKSGWLGK